MKIRNKRVVNFGDISKTFFTLAITTELGEIEINDCSIVEGARGPFVSMPQRIYKDKEGNTKYAPYIRLAGDKDAYFKTMDEILALATAECEAGKIPF